MAEVSLRGVHGWFGEPAAVERPVVFDMHDGRTVDSDPCRESRRG